MTRAQEKFIKDLLNTVTISKELKEAIEAGIKAKKISVNKASRLIKAMIELDFNWLYKHYGVDL